MAARDHRVSRRALLGAAVAAPVLSAAEGLTRHPGLNPGSTFLPSPPIRRWIPDRVRDDEEPVLSDDDEWNCALIRFRVTEAVLKEHAHDPDEDRYGRLNAAFHRALRKLIRTPAPNLRALSTKIDLAVDREVATLTGGEACLAVLKADARRLSLS